MRHLQFLLKGIVSKILCRYLSLCLDSLPNSWQYDINRYVWCRRKEKQWHFFSFSSSSLIKYSPPFVCSNIAASGKPGVEDEDTTERLTSPDPPQKSRVVRESETLAEPVHRVLLPRTLPSHLSHRAGATPPCWQRPVLRF